MMGIAELDWLAKSSLRFPVHTQLRAVTELGGTPPWIEYRDRALPGKVNPRRIVPVTPVTRTLGMEAVRYEPRDEIGATCVQHRDAVKNGSIATVDLVLRTTFETLIRVME